MDKPKITEEERALFSVVGRRFGSVGGKRAAANMTPEQRRARALKANAASIEAKRRKKAEREAQS